MAYSITAARNSIRPMPTAADDHPQVRHMRVILVLGIILGGLGTISLPLGLLRMHQGSFAGDPRTNLFAFLVERPSAEAIWLYCSSAAGAGLAFVLMATCIKAITFRPITRPILLAWAGAALTLSAIGFFFYIRWLLPPWREHYAQVRGEVDSLVNIAGWALGTVLAALILFFLTRPDVRRAFEHDQTP